KTITSSGQSFNVLNFNGSGGGWTLQDNLAVTGDLTLTAGTLDVSGSIFAISVAGTWNNAGGAFTAQAGTVTLNGASQSILGSTGFFNLTKSVASAATLTFSAGIMMWPSC
ncbi:MAG: hypothetical protein HQL22_12265, partial [Candidatus Omnitrophica bacterium]|nr:hypothetical protein [Candidatus Omnitrophota bacterium]